MNKFKCGDVLKVKDLIPLCFVVRDNEDGTIIIRIKDSTIKMQIPYEDIIDYLEL